MPISAAAIKNYTTQSSPAWLTILLLGEAAVCYKIIWQKLRCRDKEVQKLRCRMHSVSSRVLEGFRD
jgi:hypothetical protein